MRWIAIIAAFSWSAFWLTPDQQGQRLFRKGEFEAAAEAFEDPLWKGVAWYRVGEFQKAERQFARRDTAEAHFNRGNSLIFRGEYQGAVAAFERALEKRSGWQEAEENRDLAAARAEARKQEGGDMGDQRLGADEIKFDNEKRESGQDTQVDTEQAATSNDIQALWLRRVQTNPADFLRAKFSYQQAMKGEEGTP